jgi:NADPH:quinone reductase-like Zn-dependent oxidoreductase
MKALALTAFDVAPTIQELPVPEPGPGQVRIRVQAAALNAIDTFIAGGTAKTMAEYAFPVVIGRDAAGTIDALGDGAEHLAVGDEVLGHVLFGSTLHDGTVAEHALLSADAVLAKPANLDFTEAAALPLAGTAALAAVDSADLQPGQAVLIAGAGGGVGSFAIQLAAARGATVIATGLPDDAERLRSLGAAQVVDYRQDVAEQVLADHPDGVDALLDLVSYDPDSFGTLARAVRRGGKVASTAGGATDEALAAAGLVGQVVFAVPDRDTLASLLGEIERGALRVDVEQVLPLDQAAQGLETVAHRSARGKIAVAIDSPPLAKA